MDNEPIYGNGDYSYGCVGGYGFDTCSVCSFLQKKICDEIIEKRKQKEEKLKNASKGSL